MYRSYSKRWIVACVLILSLVLSACAAQQEVVGETAAEPAAEETEAPAEEAAEESEEAAEEEGEETAAEETEESAAEGDVIRIGALAPLSAPGTVVGGEAMRDAMRIAESDINARGGLLGMQVEVIIEDSEGLPERGVAVMEKLINQDGVVAVGGGYHSSVGVASKEVAADNNVPVVFAETWNDTITSSMLDPVFRIAPLSSEVAAVDVEFIKTLEGIEKVVILTENTDYGIPAAESTTEGLAEAGIEAVTFSVDIGTQDYSGIIERVKAEEPDLIQTLATGEASYNFTQQAAEAGIGPADVPTICNQVALESNAFWTNVPDGNLCFVRRIGLPVTLYNDNALAFLEQYSAMTGKTSAESYALEAYDSIMIIAQAIEEAGSTDAEAIITALEGITYAGTLGDIYFPYGRDNTPADNDVDDKFWHQWPDPAITIIQYQEEGQDSTESPIVYPDTYKTGDAILVGN